MVTIPLKCTFQIIQLFPRVKKFFTILTLDTGAQQPCFVFFEIQAWGTIALITSLTDAETTVRCSNMQFKLPANEKFGYVATSVNLVLMAAILLVGCKKESEPSVHEEVYGQEYTHEKSTDFYVSPKNGNSIPESYLAGMDVSISINNEKAKKCTLNNESVYRLEEEPDGTILLTVLLHGILENDADDWTIHCHVRVYLPWRIESSPSLPYYWEFDNTQLTGKSENMANYHARVYSGVSMFKDKGDYMEDPDTYEYQSLYPWPPGEDPRYVEFDGYAKVLEKSVITFDEPLVVLLESETVGEDHSGNIIKAIISQQ